MRILRPLDDKNFKVLKKFIILKRERKKKKKKSSGGYCCWYRSKKKKLGPIIIIISIFGFIDLDHSLRGVLFSYPTTTTTTRTMLQMSWRLTREAQNIQAKKKDQILRIRDKKIQVPIAQPVLLNIYSQLIQPKNNV